jgi:pyruvate dehydrogenase E1 component alpha subunit
MDAELQTFAEAEINQSLSPEEKVQFLRQMYRVRRFEQTALKGYNAGKMGGFLHLYTGQEAVAVALVSLLGPNDHIITAYRDHGYALAVGMSMNECMAELFGKATGASKGKGGSMHFFAADKHYWGGHGIVAGQTPVGLGIAYALKYKGIHGCCLCCLGDGAVNQGSYHESLNLASLLSLPVVYIIENNGYSMGTSLARSSAFKLLLAQRAEGYNICWDHANGENIYEVRAKTRVAMDRARDESRPTVLEVATYRYYGHSVADANARKYRTPEEIDHYKTYHDPLTVWQKRLIDEGLLTEEQASAIDHETRAEAEAAYRFADESPYPEAADILKDVYSEIDEPGDGRNVPRGTFFFN